MLRPKHLIVSQQHAVLVHEEITSHALGQFSYVRIQEHAVRTIIEGKPHYALLCMVSCRLFNPLQTNDTPMRHDLCELLWEFIWGF